MLNPVRVFPATLLLAATSLAGAAHAQDDSAERVLRRPERLTVGAADDLLGQLSHDERTLYFVSDRDTTSQVYEQNMADGRAKPAFEENADVTWPRLSPDGTSLLYISFRDQASGQLCIRRILGISDRVCLSGSFVALQAEWIDSNRIALVSRPSIKGDLQVLDVAVRPKLETRVVLERNLTSPAVSPDGRWLVYVPVARKEDAVGPAFAAHAAAQLEAQMLGASSPPVPIVLELPGQSGQPVFTRDGRWLYFVQFFADTNHDGVVDASDHGVLYRVPVSWSTGSPQVGAPEQLTEASWNCQYPAPFNNRLIMTCSQEASLDVYVLPLDGEVGGDWTAEMLETAFESASSLAEQQLLASRRLAREVTVAGRRMAMLDLALVHLTREDFRASDFYSEQLQSVGDSTTAGISAPLRLLVEQRRAMRRREQGRLIEGFGAEARARLAKLHAEGAESPMAEDLIHLVRSEIADSIGDKGLARTELEAVTVDETTPRPIVLAFYRQADALYRELDDPDALARVCAELSTDPLLTPDEQLRYARAAVRSMVRGLPHAEAAKKLEDARALQKGDAELAFALDLGREVLRIGVVPELEAKRNLLALYEREKRPGRRRALVADAVDRANLWNADRVSEALAQREIEDVPMGTRERPNAERLIRRMLTGRAYRRAHEQRFDEAREDFDTVVHYTRSYEAVVGAIDMRLKKGESPDAIQAVYEKSGVPPALSHFAHAYLLARQLPKLESEAHEKAAKTAISLLRGSWAELKGERIAEALMGALLHEEYIRTGDREMAERANVRYLIALELATRSPRFRAMILGELGILQSDVENHRIALTYLEDRDKLPYADNAEGLDVLLSMAQALLHVGRETDAVSTTERALAMIARTPGLAKYKLLALDWAAVSNLAAGRFERALLLYAEEIPLLDAGPSAAAERSRVVVRLARAAAALGANEPKVTLSELEVVSSRLSAKNAGRVLLWPHATPDQVLRSYRTIVEGLRARAFHALGNLDEEAAALARRLSVLDERFEEANREELLPEQMLTAAQLAANASDRHDAPSTRRWLGRAVGYADALGKQKSAGYTREELDVLWLAADLSVAAGAPLVPDLAARLSSACHELSKRGDAKLRPYLRRFEVDGVILSEGGGTSATPPSLSEEGATRRAQ